MWDFIWNVFAVFGICASVFALVMIGIGIKEEFDVKKHSKEQTHRLASWFLDMCGVLDELDEYPQIEMLRDYADRGLRRGEHRDNFALAFRKRFKVRKTGGAA